MLIIDENNTVQDVALPFKSRTIRGGDKDYHIIYSLEEERRFIYRSDINNKAKKRKTDYIISLQYDGQRNIFYKCTPIESLDILVKNNRIAPNNRCLIKKALKITKGIPIYSLKYYQNNYLLNTIKKLIT